MDIQLTVLRKIVDDPFVRDKNLHVIQPKHFIDKACRYLFRKIVEIGNGSVVTFDILQDVISKDSIPDRAKKALLEKLGELYAYSHVLDTDFSYAVSAISHESRVDGYLNGIRGVVNLLVNGSVDEAELRLKSLSEDVNKLKIKDDRRISARTLGQLKPDAVVDRYPTGFKMIDSVTNGGRRGELWLWAAYTGEYKSTSLLNIAHTSFVQGKKIFFVSLEMDEDELRRRLQCIHANHLKNVVRYRDLETGAFDSPEQQEIARAVADDFDNNSSYGDIQIWQPSLGVNIFDLAKELEICCGEKDCEVVIIDYVQKLAPIKQRSKIREEMNETLDAAKRLAMEARRRDGVWLISGYQTSTEGRKKAEKTGFYDLWALSETIGASQVANVVCWSLVTESMMKSKEVKVGLAKSRNSSIRGSHHYLVSDPEIGLLSKQPVRSTPEVEVSDENFLDDVVEID